MTDLRRTPLFDLHRIHGGRMIDFGGWELPVYYGSAIEEHNTVRNAVGIFDVSHMGEIEITGEGAYDAVQRLTTNDIGRLKPGGVQYSVLCYEDGGIVDDILVYKFSDTHFFLCVNAGNSDKDYLWIKKTIGENNKVKVINSSSQYAQFAVQGRYAKDALHGLIDEEILNIRSFTFKTGLICGREGIISRTGYTGEDGFEIYIKPEDAPFLWEKILENGKSFGIKPIGLSARDTLRLESGYMLYGNDINEKTSPIEAGLSWIVKIDKGNFIGKAALEAQIKNGISKKLIGFELKEKGIPRSHYPLFYKDRQVGEVASGTLSITLEKPIGMAYVDNPKITAGEEMQLDIRGKRLKGEVVKLPFYKR